MIYEVGTQGKKSSYMARYIVEADSIDDAIKKARQRDLSQEVTDVMRLEKYTCVISE